MARFLHLSYAGSFRKLRVVFLALSWCIGLYLGVVLFHASGASVTSLMGAAVYSRISIFSTLIPFILPFLISAIAVYLHRFAFLSVVCMCKAVLFSFTSCSLISGFGNAGWLIHLLFMFGDICFCIVLIFFWLRYAPGRRPFSGKETIGFLFAGIVAAGLDHFAVFPYLQGILML